MSIVALVVGAMAIGVAPLASATVPVPPAGRAAARPAGLVASPARVETPASVVVLGDSISQATGSNGSGAPGGMIGSPRPAASWATGSRDGLDSYAQRLGALRGRDVEALNLSANGATMREHFVDQAMSVPEGTELVLVQMGGNDLCRSSEADMTPVDEFRREFRAGLAWLADHRPDTLVQVSSIPDIYSLWYVRGAAHKGEQWPVLGFVVSGREGPRAPRSFEENNNKRAARLLWHTLGVIPCDTMLASPNVPRNAGPTPDPTHPAEQRRLRVRAHNIALNEVLADECDAVLRCRHDDGAVFDLVANRDADGHLLADKDRWTFVDDDISTQDHFHPSFAGQRKLAGAAWASGYDWTDVAAPVPHVALRSSGGGPVVPADGWSAAPVTVDVRYDDDAGVRGIEYRVHAAEAIEATTALDWTPVAGDGMEVEVRADGEWWVETRALDVNGNLSESRFVPVRVDTTRPDVHVEAPGDGDEVVLGSLVLARHHCADDVSRVVACESSLPLGRHVDTSTVGTVPFGVTATDAAGNVTVVDGEYHVRYGWSGTAAPLRRGEPREVRAGSVLPVRFALTDASGRPVVDAEVDVALIGPDGVERRATSWLRSMTIDRAVYSAAHCGHILLVDTRGLPTGVWDVVIRPDDGSEHRVNVVLGDR